MTATSAPGRSCSASSPLSAREHAELRGENGLERVEHARLVVDDQDGRGSSMEFSASPFPEGPFTEAAAPRPAAPGPEDLVERLAILQPLELRGAQLAMADEIAHLAERALGGDDMRVEEPCHALDAGGRDHRPAHHDQLAPLGRADGPGHHRARGDAHPDVEAREALAGPGGGQRAHRGHHLDRRPHRPRRRVLAALGHAEQDDDLVADELLDRALVAEDHLDHLGEVLVEEPDHDRARAWSR